MEDKIFAKTCPSLSKELGLEMHTFEKSYWEPPKDHGLQNADVIIPSYYNYHKNPEKVFELDYLNIIKDDIRNFRVLNKYQLEYIRNLSDEDKFEIVCLFNKCIISINDLF